MTYPGGNCHAACLASILELPLDVVDSERLMENDNWFAATNQWLRQYGVQLLLLTWNTEDAWPLDAHTICILSGPSPRGDWWHATVAQNGAIIHDPHVEGGGLRGTRREIEVFVAINPVDNKHSKRQTADHGSV